MYANETKSGSYVDLTTFVKAQHFCRSVVELAEYLNMKPNAVRQRIKFLIRRGHGKKLRPYADLIGKKGRVNFAKQVDELPDWNEPVYPNPDGQSVLPIGIEDTMPVDTGMGFVNVDVNQLTHANEL